MAAERRAEGNSDSSPTVLKRTFRRDIMKSLNRGPGICSGPFYVEENMRTAMYLIAVFNILLGLYMVYGKPDVFKGRTLKDVAEKAGKRRRSK